MRKHYLAFENIRRKMVLQESFIMNDFFKNDLVRMTNHCLNAMLFEYFLS